MVPPINQWFFRTMLMGQSRTDGRHSFSTSCIVDVGTGCRVTHGLRYILVQYRDKTTWLVTHDSRHLPSPVSHNGNLTVLLSWRQTRIHMDTGIPLAYTTLNHIHHSLHGRLALLSHKPLGVAVSHGHKKHR